MDLIEQQASDGTIEVAIEGELDLSTAPKLREWLLRSIEIEKRRVTQLDFDRCTFVDSAAIGVLVEAAGRLDEQVQTLRIINLRDQPERIFELTGIGPVAGLERIGPGRAAMAGDGQGPAA
jgi:anti-anti-sigma factor